MPSISAVIITYNEEKNIARCIESVRDVADEILVVDSFSTDATESICKDHGVNFIQHPFEGHIEQKNYALSQAQHDCVLSLDADEALSSELAAGITAIKNNWQHDSYAFNRLTSYCGQWIKHCGWYPDPKIRLFSRKKASWGGVNPHDRIIMASGATTRHIPGDLLHYTFNTVAEHIAQINKFSEIKAAGLFRKGRSVNLLRMGLEPLFKFFKSYVLKAGFLDGWYGLILCANSAHAIFLRYAKLHEKNKAARTQK
jgi:glycosyltransferase involved in cell wall biosynthesis